jgi:hypothetical protein
MMMMMMMIIIIIIISKAVPLHAMKALGGRGGIAATHSRPRHYMGVSGQRHSRPRFTPGERTPR